MSFHLVLTSSAKRDLYGLPPKIIDAVIAFVEGPLLVEPRRVGRPLLMSDLAGRYGARRGAYRIVYRIDGDTVYVQRIDHRRDVYRPR